MNLTQYGDINRLLEELLISIRKILGKKLVGLYLYGSLVWGDFDYDTSDIDLLAALISDLSLKEFSALEEMHEGFSKKYKNWNDRIEVQYLSSHGLKTFKNQSTKVDSDIKTTS